MLCGSGEFTPAMDAIDRELLSGLPPRTRVAIVPTAAGLEDTPTAWVAKGTAHFRALGAEPFGVMVLTRADANDPRCVAAIAAADWVYFSGGDPGHLVETLEGSPFWAAVCERLAAGALLAGSSAGAMMLGQTTFVPHDRGPDGFPTRVTTRAAMNLVPEIIVAPHFDIFPAPLVSQWAGVVPRGHRLLGIDEDTALLQRDGAWVVRGRGRVQVFRTLEDVSAYTADHAVDGFTRGALP